jgi:hypothetical protein
MQTAMDEVLLKQLRAELEHDRDDILSTLAALPPGEDDPLREMLSAGVADLRLALEKMDGNRYGICESCSKAMDDARLKMLPSARECLRCETKSTEGAQA